MNGATAYAVTPSRRAARQVAGELRRIVHGAQRSPRPSARVDGRQR